MQRFGNAAWALCLAAFLFSGCDRALKQRTEEIREFSDREDRAFREEALKQVQRQYWTVRGKDWYGRLPDGRIVELVAPKVTPAALPSVAFYRGWHLQLTVASEEWQGYPAGDGKGESGGYAVVYAITRQSAQHWDIRVSDGAVTEPLRREDAARVAEEH
jgi:hypothetical protein